MAEKIVYFTKKITPESLVKIYKKINSPLTGNIAIKLHSGEDGNQNYVKPEFVKDLIDYVNGTVVECNTAYNGQRNSTNKHLNLLEKHLLKLYQKSISHYKREWRKLDCPIYQSWLQVNCILHYLPKNWMSLHNLIDKFFTISTIINSIIQHFYNMMSYMI